MPIVGPVKKHLDDWEEAGRKGWRVKISELSETIDAYEGDPDAPDYVVFSVKWNTLYFLGQTREEDAEETPETTQTQDESITLASTQPKDPGEIDQFPPWPPG